MRVQVNGVILYWLIVSAHMTYCISPFFQSLSFTNTLSIFTFVSMFWNDKLLIYVILYEMQSNLS